MMIQMEFCEERPLDKALALRDEKLPQNQIHFEYANMQKNS